MDLPVLGEEFKAADELHLGPIFEDLGDGVAQAAFFVLPDFERVFLGDLGNLVDGVHEDDAVRAFGQLLAAAHLLDTAEQIVLDDDDVLFFGNRAVEQAGAEGHNLLFG